MKYTVYDLVEVGHNKETGGTIKVSLTFDNYVEKEHYLTIIDYLDHSLITDNQSDLEFTKRFFLMKNNANKVSSYLFDNIRDIIHNFLTNHSCILTLELDKEIITFELDCNNKPNTLLNYYVKG